MSLRLAVCALLAALTLLPALPLSAGQPDQETAFWEARLKRDPFDHISRVKLGAAYLQKSRVEGDYRQVLRAEATLREALAGAPNSYDGLVGLAFALNAQHRFAEGARAARQAVELRPEALTGRGALGDALFEQGDLPGAALAYGKLVELDGGLFALTRHARLRFIRGDTQGAIEELHRAAEIGRARGAAAEEIARCLVMIGERYFQQGKYDSAETQYRAALELWPDGHLPLEHLAKTRALRGDPARALAIYERLIGETERPDLLRALGSLHAAMGDAAAAARWYDRALQSYLASADAGYRGYYRDLALFYTDIRADSGQALHWAQKDLALRKDVYSYDTLAWALFQNGKFEDAQDAAVEALKHGTEDATLWYHAGRIVHALGDKETARQYLDRALRINPRHAQARLAIFDVLYK